MLEREVWQGPSPKTSTSLSVQGGMRWVSGVVDDMAVGDSHQLWTGTFRGEASGTGYLDRPGILALRCLKTLLGEAMVDLS